VGGARGSRPAGAPGRSIARHRADAALARRRSASGVADRVPPRPQGRQHPPRDDRQRPVRLPGPADDPGRVERHHRAMARRRGLRELNAALEERVAKPDRVGAGQVRPVVAPPNSGRPARSKVSGIDGPPSRASASTTAALIGPVEPVCPVLGARRQVPGDQAALQPLRLALARSGRSRTVGPAGCSPTGRGWPRVAERHDVTGGHAERDVRSTGVPPAP
jgi:hypothetical protein